MLIQRYMLYPETIQVRPARAVKIIIKELISFHVFLLLLLYIPVKNKSPQFNDASQAHRMRTVRSDSFRKDFCLSLGSHKRRAVLDIIIVKEILISHHDYALHVI